MFSITSFWSFTREISCLKSPFFFSFLKKYFFGLSFSLFCFLVGLLLSKFSLFFSSLSSVIKLLCNNLRYIGFRGYLSNNRLLAVILSFMLLIGDFVKLLKCSDRLIAICLMFSLKLQHSLMTHEIVLLILISWIWFSTSFSKTFSFKRVQFGAQFPFLFFIFSPNWVDNFIVSWSLKWFAIISYEIVFKIASVVYMRSYLAL